MIPASAPIFFAVEVEVYQPETTPIAFDLGHGTRAHGTITLLPSSLEQPGIIRASDLGYRTREGDAGGLQVYPPILDSAFEIDRRIALSPSDASSETYGQIRLSNLGERFDAYLDGRNSDNRPARILLGRKTFDASRGILLDPPYANLVPFFAGVGLAWLEAEEELTVPLADPAAWLDRPVQTSFFAGSGGLQGGADLAGKPRPMTRGGTSNAPVQDVPLVLVDAVALIYQWTDGPGTLLALYEGGAAVFVADADVADLYTVSPAPGHYATCNARGVLRLGSKPVGTLSADVTGSYPISNASTPAAMALALLQEDMGLSSALLDLPSFAASDAAFPYAAGYHVGTDPIQGPELLATVLASINGRLIAARDGLLSCFLLAALAPGAVPDLDLDTSNTVSVTAQALPTTVDPPPYRVQVGYGKIWQTQTTGFNTTISAARQAELAAEYRYATAFSATVRREYRRANDLAPIATCLLLQSQAAIIAGTVLNLFQARPGYYEVVVPIEVAASIELGSLISIEWPLADLVGGQLGQVVGEQIRSVDNTVTFDVLMTGLAGKLAQPNTAELGIFEIGVHELAHF